MSRIDPRETERALRAFPDGPGVQRRDHRCIGDQFNSWPHHFDGMRDDLAWQRGRYRRHRGHGRLQRSRENRMIAGIAGGIATRLGRDVTIVRIVLVLAGLVSGFGVIAYVVGWLVLPVEGSSETIGARALSDRQGITIAIALVPALVVVLLVGAELHANFVSSWGLPLLISAAGLVLIYRNAEDDERVWLDNSVKALLQLGSEPRQSATVVPHASRRRPRAVRLRGLGHLGRGLEPVVVAALGWDIAHDRRDRDPARALVAETRLRPFARTPGPHPRRGAGGHGRPST